MIYLDVFKALNRAKVKYVVVGGVAVILYGYERFTKDLDLVIHLEAKNIDKLFDALEKAGYKPRVPVSKDQFKDEKLRKKWQKEKGMLVFTFCHRDPPFKNIDVFINDPMPFKKIYEHRKNAVIEGVKIPLVDVEHLRILKERANRPQDIIDLRQLDEIIEFKDQKK